MNDDGHLHFAQILIIILIVHLQFAHFAQIIILVILCWDRFYILRIFLWRPLLYLLLEPALACGYLSLGSGQKEAIFGKWKCIIRGKEKATSWEIPEKMFPSWQSWPRCSQNSPKRTTYDNQYKIGETFSYLQTSSMYTSFPALHCALHNAAHWTFADSITSIHPRIGLGKASDFKSGLSKARVELA